MLFRSYKNYKICTVCGQGEGDENDGVPDVVKIKALGHDYKAEALVPATCNSKGLSISKCTHCGKYEEKDGAYVTAPIDKVKEHVASDKLANVKEATCTEEGYTGDVVCKFCGEVMNIAWMNALEAANDNKQTFDQCIMFTSDFHSPKNGGGAWNPDEEYTGWQWWLARSNGGKWKLMTWGY